MMPARQSTIFAIKRLLSSILYGHSMRLYLHGDLSTALPMQTCCVSFSPLSSTLATKKIWHDCTVTRYNYMYMCTCALRTGQNRVLVLTLMGSLLLT